MHSIKKQTDRTIDQHNKCLTHYLCIGEVYKKYHWHISIGAEDNLKDKYIKHKKLGAIPLGRQNTDGKPTK